MSFHVKLGSHVERRKHAEILTYGVLVVYGLAGGRGESVSSATYL